MNRGMTRILLGESPASLIPRYTLIIIALELRSLPLTHTWKRSGKGWCAIIGKTYGGLLSNTYKFAPRKVQQSRDFGSSGALFGTEKLSGKILLYSIRDICNLYALLNLLHT